MILHWKIFSAAPHRMMFFGGMFQIILTMVWWLLELLGRYTYWWEPLPTVTASSWVHAFLMLYGLPAFFIFGFLMTTYPRWMRGQMILYKFLYYNFYDYLNLDK